ncbi:helix-turn-helix transcriptional regulator [Pseudovibrio ascidiaceicola]|uniref:helix-turn-helix transcriptional regulator n=1 Tax=Pseudovibrio ascidiaceicola TaxID=285279 RepID=UPI003D36C464
MNALTTTNFKSAPEGNLPLTPAECAVVDYMISGKTLAEYAADKGISKRTAEQHVSNARKKYQAKMAYNLTATVAAERERQRTVEYLKAAQESAQLIYAGRKGTQTGIVHLRLSAVLRMLLSDIKNGIGVNAHFNPITLEGLVPAVDRHLTDTEFEEEQEALKALEAKSLPVGGAL